MEEFPYEAFLPQYRNDVNGQWANFNTTTNHNAEESINLIPR